MENGKAHRRRIGKWKMEKGKWAGKFKRAGKDAGGTNARTWDEPAAAENWE
jgi:hypothetical protein